MNWLKIIGIVLIVLVANEMLRIVLEYTSGKMESWPFGVEIGAGLTIWLAIFLIRRGNRQKRKL